MAGSGQEISDAVVVPIPQPDEPFEPRERYVPPHVRNLKVGPLFVTTLECAKCGVTFAYADHWLYDDEQPVCKRCELVPLVIPPEVAAVMAHVRWKLDEHRKAAGFSGASRAEHREAALAAAQAAWIHGPMLLEELERIYADQLVKQVHEIANG